MNHDLEKILNPSSIAFLGASSNIAKPGTMHLLSLVSSYKGKIYPIHPRTKEILGLKTYKSLEDLPEVVDLVVIMVPGDGVSSLLEQAGKLGIKHAIIVSAGYSETGDRGKKLQEELNKIAQKYNMRFLGPNCIGVVNPANGLNTTFFAIKNGPGSVGIISQSGSFITQTLHYFSKIGLRISKAISVGNQANTDLVDCLEYLGMDESTKVIGLYIEGIKRVRDFLNMCRSIVFKKPIIAVYAGGTEAGARASISHTASLSAKDELYTGLFKQAGIIRADSMLDLFNMSLVLSTEPLMENNRVCIITNSGGPGACLADQCERENLMVPPLKKSTQKLIKDITLKFSSAVNPIDITMSFDYELLGYKLPKIVFENEDIDGIIIYGIFGPMHIEDKIKGIRDKIKSIPEDIFSIMKTYSLKACKKLVEFKNKIKKPIIVSSLTGNEDPAIKYLQEHNVPVIIGFKNTVLAMKSLLEYKKIKDKMEKIESNG